MQFMGINTLLVRFFSLIILVCHVLTTLVTLKMLAIGPNKELRKLDLTLHLLHVLQLLTILNGEEHIKRWDNKTIILNFMQNHM